MAQPADLMVILIAPNVSEQMGGEAIKSYQIYRELAQRGSIVAIPGKGTRVAEPPLAAGHSMPLRRAAVVHQIESVLLSLLAAGYSLPEVEQAVNLALDRWRVLTQEPPPGTIGVLRFAGSHDPAAEAGHTWNSL